MARIRTVAVVSAGKLGRDIARSLSLAGYATVLEDVIPSTLRNAETEIRSGLATENQRISGEAAGLCQIKFADSLDEAAREADLVIEAVPDELESKLEIFTLLDRICRPGTILVSTTSHLSLTDIASVTFRKSKCVGMRFRNLISSKQLEIVRAGETADETVAAVVEMLQRMGFDISVIKDNLHFGEPVLTPTNA